MKHSQLKQLIKEEIRNTLNEGRHLSKMLGAANLKFGVDGNLYFIIGSDSYSGAANLQISKKDLPKFFKMVRDAEAQVNSLSGTLNEGKKYLNDMSYEELIALRKRMDFKKASREVKKYVKDLIDKKKPLNEEKITIEDGDIEFIRVALNLAANTLKNKIRLTDDERNQLDNLLDKFGIDVKDRSGVDATASQLDRR
jgi:hypothetical protein